LISLSTLGDTEPFELVGWLIFFLIEVLADGFKSPIENIINAGVFLGGYLEVLQAFFLCKLLCLILADFSDFLVRLVAYDIEQITVHGIFADFLVENFYRI
jgi:hypothetical protein